MAQNNSIVESAPHPAPELPPADHLNEVGVLKRREIEARILLPILEAFEKQFGEQRVREIAREVILELARAQGAELMQQAGCCNLRTFAVALDDWKKGDAYDMQVLEQSDDRLDFNVTRCRYAEMYHRLGVPWLGRLLSCNRDYALIEGFNPDVKLTRTQTIMEGAAYCDFRFERRPNSEDKG
jgi:predicted ArsR family transcriptional regulator